MSRRVAVIEDEYALRENYADVLRKQGYSVQTFANRKDAMMVFEQRLPDLAIIDIGLEDEADGGFTLCRSLRSLSETLPIIFLTARDSDVDTVSGLRIGADDYLTKDISFPHLLARIAALFRRQDAMGEPISRDAILKQGSLNMDTQRMIATWKNHHVDLTITEYWMVYALAKYVGHVKNRQQLMQESQMVVDDSTITSHIKRIRKKFIKVDAEFNCIDTVYGMGYRWDLDVTS